MGLIKMDYEKEIIKMLNNKDKLRMKLIYNFIKKIYKKEGK